MEAKEKALELVLKFNKIWGDVPNVPIKYSITRYDAKQCAIIAVDEIIETISDCSYDCQGRGANYWEEVKQEIEKL